MNEDFMESNFLEVDDNLLAENEEIICRHCTVVSFVEYSAEVDQEIIDFSDYSFHDNEGFVFWQQSYTGKGTDELTINNNCMVSQQLLPDGSTEFYWWPAGTITFYKE